MVVVGADVHKRSHTFVVVDQVGREVGTKTVPATTKGHQAAMRWVWDRFDTEVVWAIEDCRHLSARLERDLLGAGQSVVRVPPKMMAEQRRLGRARGKSDPIDAAAVARAALREPALPRAHHDEVSRELKLRTDHRDDLVKSRTALINRLLWRVHEIEPAWAPPKASLDRLVQQQRLAERLATVTGALAEIASAELADIITLTERINQLEKRLAGLAKTAAPSLLTLQGVGTLTAAKLVGETAGVARFTSEAAFARHAGIAPIPVWSGHTAGRVRLTRSGNRQLNAAIYRIAITQIRSGGLGRAYYDKKRAEGMTKAEALRCLKRRLARIVYNHLVRDQHHQTTTPTPLPAAA